MSDAGSDAGSRAPEAVEDVEVAAPAKGQMSVEDALQEVLKVSKNTPQLEYRSLGSSSRFAFDSHRTLSFTTVSLVV
jgi:hypothetical protein